MKRIIAYTLILAMIPFLGISQEKELPPEGGTPKGFTLPEKETFTLENGLSGVLIPWGSIPKATIQFVVKTGNINEGPDEVWLSDVTGDLMKEGSTFKDGDQIADEIASMGGDLNIGRR